MRRTAQGGTLWNHMTQRERLYEAMTQAWGAPNLSRLSRESGVSWSQVSKIANERQRLTPYMAGRLAPALGVKPESLIPAEEEEATIANVHRLLRQMNEDLNTSRSLTATAVIAMDNRLESIETLLRSLVAPSRTAQG